MTPTEKHIKQRQELVQKRQKALRASIRFAQGVLLSSLIDILLQLEADEEGKLKYNAKNIRKAGLVGGLVSAFSLQAGRTLAKRMIKGVLGILGINKRYFKTVTTVNIETVEEKARNRVLQELGYNPKTGKLIKDKWLWNLTAATEVKQQIFKRVNDALAGGMDIATFRKQFKDDFTSNKNGLGILDRHYYNSTHDLYISVDRKVQNVYARELGLKYFIYSGIRIENTREFCDRRLNVIFHVEFFEKWDKQQWKGKKQGSTRINMGGYNCIHHASFISEEMKDVMVGNGTKLNHYNKTPVLG